MPERKCEDAERNDREHTVLQLAPLLAPPPLRLGALEGEAYAPPKDECTLQPHRRREVCGRGPEVRDQAGSVSHVSCERRAPHPLAEGSPDIEAPLAHAASIDARPRRGIIRTG